jgi:hypothetical protein
MSFVHLAHWVASPLLISVVVELTDTVPLLEFPMALLERK